MPATLWSLAGAAPALTIALGRMTPAGLRDPDVRAFVADQFGADTFACWSRRNCSWRGSRMGPSDRCWSARPAARGCRWTSARSWARSRRAIWAGRCALADLVGSEHLGAAAGAALGLGEALADTGAALTPRAGAVTLD